MISIILRRAALVAMAGGVAFLGLSLFADAPLAPSARAAPPARDVVRAKDAYDLSSQDIFRKVIVNIKDNYVDPKRVEPKEMFLAALESVEKATPEVMVEGSAKDGRVKVTCAKASREFEFKDVESVWMIPYRMRPVFAFLQENLSPQQDRHEVEYAAINGMLSTLDPHSWLLKPDQYREMKLQTKGEFGGLGFVISMDEEKLTVKRILKNTPAFRAGIKRGDHISRIEDESTINMDLNEAVSKLRGKPGTEVRIFVRRGTEEEKEQRLVRDLISIESVTSQLLAGGVGYARLSSFAGTTARDLQGAIAEMKKGAGGKLNGLVLDLRSNPGGLLEQSSQVADLFVESGTIVTTAGQIDRVREERNARADGGEKEFPIAVLVNSESASASEIVAGALKNLNRAVIVGRQTFGKGSVQVLYDLPEPGTKEEAALKLTIAQYLTPGNQSIQEIGVTPDIELVTARVSKERVDLFAPPRLMREADLDKHFLNGFAPAVEAKAAVAQAEKPGVTLRYLRDEPAPKKKAEKDAKDPKATKEVEIPAPDADDDEAAADEPDEDRIAQDYQVQFARELVLRAPQTDRKLMMEAAKPFLAERRGIEEAKIQKAVEALGIDWSEGAKILPGAPIAATTDFKVTPARPVAGETAVLTVTVQNTGKTTLERLRAYTKCAPDKTAFQSLCSLLDRREFLLGKVAPGEKRSWSTSVKFPAHMPAAHETFALIFEEAHGNAPELQRVEVECAELPRPSFAFTYQVLDRDGLAEPGETVDVQIDVRNTGTGASSKSTYVSLRNSMNEKIFMKRGRVQLGELKPGESRSATVSLEVKPGFDASAGIPLKLEIGDRDMWEFTAGKVTLPAMATPPAWTDAAGLAKFDHDVLLLAAPLASAPPVAQARKGSVASISGRVGDYVAVQWTKGRTAFVRATDAAIDTSAKAAKEKPTDTQITAAMYRDPPQIALAAIDLSSGPVVVDADHFKLDAAVNDVSGLLDVRAFVDNEKVFYRPAVSDAAKELKVQKLPFSTDFPLKVGNNMVVIIAREDEEFASQRTVIVNRRPPSLADRKAPEPAPR